MSCSSDAAWVYCDREGCRAETRLPVGLRATLMHPNGRAVPPEGWLFVVRLGGCRHYCPACARSVLTLLGSESLAW